MNSPLRVRHFYLPFIFLLAVIIADAGSDGKADRSAPQIRAATTPPPDIAGSWAGVWDDTRYFVTDSLRFDIAVNAGIVTGTGMLSLGALGQPDEPGTIFGSIIADTLTFGFTTNTALGGGPIINNDIQDGVGIIGGVLQFGPFTFTGTVTDAAMDFDFVFTSPTGGFGVVNLVKTGVPVEPVSWGEVKEKFSDR